MKIDISRPAVGEYAPYYGRYVDQVEGEIISILNEQIEWYSDYIKFNADRMDYSYGPEKWTIREALIHIIDTEQIFAYRALRIGRNDKTPLAGYNQDDFIAKNDFSHISPFDILEEFLNQRRATISMIKKFKPSDLDALGVASDNAVSVRGLIYIIAGHSAHHQKIFEERYA